MRPQDAIQRNGDEWLFTVYDAFGRVAYTGIDSNNTSSRTAMQAAANAASNQYVRKTATANTYAGTTVYYTKDAFPVSFDKVLTINYYDNYTFDKAGLAAPTSVLGQAVDTRTKGLATGSKARVLTTDQWITTLMVYDKKGRAVYTATKNPYLGTTDIVETELDFAGKVKQTKTAHTKDSGPAIVTVDRFGYDHRGRLLEQTQTLGGSTELIAGNIYDDLGQ
ncbi:RHS repeat-associated core domain-containing protein, partial [Galbibacter sp. EGI 63066]|nr:RHS repeat-associated core domain-containing protein [Galbibacter sp. EGI 63066]